MVWTEAGSITIAEKREFEYYHVGPSGTSFLAEGIFRRDIDAIAVLFNRLLAVPKNKWLSPKRREGLKSRFPVDSNAGQTSRLISVALKRLNSWRILSWQQRPLDISLRQ
jgi:hypothetical protein